jgi:hypothetical protein
MNLLGLLAARWDGQAQCLLDEHDALVTLFQRALDVLRAGDQSFPALVDAMERVVSAGPPADYRLTTLIERTNRANAVAVDLIEACDRALDRPELSGLLPVRADLLRHLEQQAAGRSFQAMAPAGPAGRNGGAHAQSA